jgi:dihydropteroate synthase-like protein
LKTNNTRYAEVVSESSAKVERILFVTGRLAEPALRQVLATVSEAEQHRDFEVEVLGISVAALMHVDWVRQKLPQPEGFDRVILPGWCQGELSVLEEQFGVRFESGPKDLFDLPDFLSGKKKEPPDLSAYDIRIVAEINHAPRMTDEAILAMALRYKSHGADTIDVGCIPGESWSRIDDVIKRLVDEGLHVSVDSFDRTEVEAAVKAGASLVFSANGSNVDWLSQLGVEVIAIPDDIRNIDTLEPTIRRLEEQGCPYRVDPILEPIGFGFTASLARYYEARRRWPDAEMLMGIGNVTELTEVDTAGVNMLLAAICQELNVFSVLTTEVINWARSAVLEFDFARRLIRHSISSNVLPKHLDSSLVMLRDPKVNALGQSGLEQLAGQLKDPGFRIFVEGNEIHLMNRDGYWHGTDAFELFDEAVKTCEMDAAHAFYLGYEMAKAVTALTLGKQYNQDRALSWGLLTIPEVSAHERRKRIRG